LWHNSDHFLNSLNFHWASFDLCIGITPRPKSNLLRLRIRNDGLFSFASFTDTLCWGAQAATTLYCTTVEDIYAAMVSVQAGDEIVIAPGLYLADKLAISGTGAHFASYADGTEQAPIVMRSEDANNPAILSGENAGSLSCIRIFGAFWKIHNLAVTNAQKGNAPFGEVINCTVSSFVRSFVLTLHTLVS
jgi:hypothetical protein